MQCPTCRQHTPDAWTQLSRVFTGGGYVNELTVEPPLVDGVTLGAGSLVSIDHMACANPACRELIIRVHENTNVPPGYQLETSTRTWIARPKSASRPIDPLVPDPFRTDYLEAAAILEPSPRMSAALARRIVFDLLEGYAGIKEYTLKAGLDKFVADTAHPQRIRDNLQHLREIGDFGAHTQKDEADVILDVSREDAEWTLDLIDRLFEYFIVEPEKDKRLRRAWDQKLSDAGRKPIPPAPPDPEVAE
jgi:hypothetical protein